MTIADYRAAGYELSNQVNSNSLGHAENDVFECYIKPIAGDNALISDFKNEVMALAYCLLLRRNAVKTRFGAESKNNQYGTVLTLENHAINFQIAGICKPIIDKLKATYPSDTTYKIIDIIDCGINIF